MKKGYRLRLLVLVAIGAAWTACHKSAGSTVLLGPYVESSPSKGGMTLNFLWSGQVIASGPNSFWTSGTTGEALNYSLSSDSVGSVITFVPAAGAGSWFDTASFIYTAVSSREISLEVPPCPPGVPCYAGAGDVYVFER